MNDRNARPEWRAAFLNRTVTRRTLRAVAAVAVAPETMTSPNPASRPARNVATRRAPAAVAAPTRAPRASLGLPIAAMLRLLPTA